MKCRNPECQADMDTNAVYCGICGTTTLSFCTNCGEELPVERNIKSCPQCGTLIRDMKLPNNETVPSTVNEKKPAKRRRYTKELAQNQDSDNSYHSVASRKTKTTSQNRELDGETEKSDLIEYLSIIADMENNLYTQKEIEEKLKSNSMSLAKPNSIYKPVMPTGVNAKDKENANSCVRDYERKRNIGIALLSVFIVCILFALTAEYSRRIETPYQIAAGIGEISLFVGIGFCISAIRNRSDAKKATQRIEQEEAQYNKALQQYEKSMAEYQQAIIDDEKRVKRETREKALIDLEIQSLQSQMVQSKQRLADFYDIGIIGPKYRDIVSINTIYEYFLYKRCSTLGEAYNRLEDESRLNIIILKLDKIIAQLDDIRQNQYLVYTAIQQGNTIANEIAQSTIALSTKLDNMKVQQADYTQELKHLQETSSITAYNSERISKELHYMNRMKYFAGEYNGLFFNLPPN